MEEVLSREDMSVEKGRELDAVFASFTVDKGAKRLSSKMKAYLAKKVDTSVDSIQAYWLCFRRNNLKWVRRTVLFLLGQLCERNSWACFGLFKVFYFSLTFFPQEEEKVEEVEKNSKRSLEDEVEKDLDKADKGDDKAEEDEVNKGGKRDREHDNTEDQASKKKRREHPPTTSEVDVKGGVAADGLDGVVDNGDDGEEVEEGEGRRGGEESSDGRQGPARSFCCELCGRTFKQPNTLKRHVDCHRLPFSCEFCSDAFSRRGSLRSHLSKHHSVTDADMHKYVPFSRLPYSDGEEVTLVRTIVDKNAYERMNQSSALWKELEEEEVLENRTARGLHSHFEREILPNLKTGKKSYGLAEKELALFKKWQSDKERKQEKRRQMTDMEKKQQREKDVIEEEELRTEQEKKDREEEKEGDGEGQSNLQLGYQESPYFRENPTAIAVGSEEGSMELFQHYLEGLEGYKVRSTDVNTEKGTIRKAHFLSPDGYILKTRQGVLEYLAVERKTSIEDIVTIGRNILKVSDRRIKSFLNNWTDAIEATTFSGVSSSDEDEAAKEEAEREDDINSGLTCYIYIMSYKYLLIMPLF